MLALLHGLVPETLWPLVFVAVFLLIGGVALYLTPRLSDWLDKRREKNPGYFDDMLTSDPEQLIPEKKEEEK